MEKVWVGLEIRSINNLIRRYFEFSSHRREIETITGNNGWIIGYLSDNAGKDIYQKNIEDHFTITRSTASKVLTLMEQKGLIERRNVSRDARLKKIVPTEKALKLKGLMKEDAQRMEDTLTNGFSDEEIETMLSYFQRMKENLSGVKSDAL